MNPQPYALRRMLPDPPRRLARLKRVLVHVLLTTFATALLIAFIAAVNVLFS